MPQDYKDVFAERAKELFDKNIVSLEPFSNWRFYSVKIADKKFKKKSLQHDQKAPFHQKWAPEKFLTIELYLPF